MTKKWVKIGLSELSSRSFLKRLTTSQKSEFLCFNFILFLFFKEISLSRSFPMFWKPCKCHLNLKNKCILSWGKGNPQTWKNSFYYQIIIYLFSTHNPLALASSFAAVLYFECWHIQFIAVPYDVCHAINWNTDIEPIKPRITKRASTFAVRL